MCQLLNINKFKIFFFILCCWCGTNHIHCHVLYSKIGDNFSIFVISIPTPHFNAILTELNRLLYGKQVFEEKTKLAQFKTGWMKVNSKEVYYYLTKLHSSDIFPALLIPYDKSQVIRVVTVLIYLDCYVFVRVAAWDTVEEREREREISLN